VDRRRPSRLGGRDGRTGQQQSVQYSGADVVSLMEPVLRIVIFFIPVHLLGRLVVGAAG
jgi:hypothetical protein